MRIKLDQSGLSAFVKFILHDESVAEIEATNADSAKRIITERYTDGDEVTDDDEV